VTPTAAVSSGLLLFRRTANGLEVFLAHPGGPFWAKRDAGAWSIHPQGPFLPLGAVKQKSGKVVHAWAWEGDANASLATSNATRTEWPRGSGRWVTFPEVDRCEWFDAGAAREKINAAQAEFIARLELLLAETNMRDP
jgi:predicted NUDIX family NTP pyrophosphohydrolase